MRIQKSYSQIVVGNGSRGNRQTNWFIKTKNDGEIHQVSLKGITMFQNIISTQILNECFDINISFFESGL